MPLDNLPAKLVVPTRDQLFTENLRLMKLRAPAAVAVGDGEQANYDAAVLTDATLPIYGECVRASAGDDLDGKTGSELDTVLSDCGLPPRAPAKGASGFVKVSASVGGAQVVGDDGTPGTGDELKNNNTGILYEAEISGIYVDAQACAVVGVTTGPSTNLAAGAVLQWASPRPGMNITATVLAPGLTGGSNQESDDQVRARIRSSRANPAASGNDAAYIAAAKATPGIAVEQAFMYSDWNGPGSTFMVFTIVPAQPGASRIPNNAQIGLVQGYVISQFDRSDACAFGFITAQNRNVKLAVKWVPNVASWFDNIPWPPNDGFDYTAAGTPTATAFNITCSGAGTAPQVGQNIAFFDKTNLRFVVKRILSVVAHAGPNWDIVVDQSNNASDTTFAPAVGAFVSPWSTSLGLLVLPVVTFFDGLGPGEMFGVFFDNGFRQKRNPPDPQFFQESVTSAITAQLLDLAAINNVTVLSPALPFAPTVGTPGVTVRLLVLSDLGVVPG